MPRRAVTAALAAPVLLSPSYPDSAGTVVLKRFSDQVGVTYPAGSPTVVVTSEVDGQSMIRLTTAVSTNAEIEIAPSASISAPRNGNVVILCYIPDSTAVSEIRLFAGPANYSPGWWQNQYTVNASGSMLRDRSGWHAIEAGRLIGAFSGTFNWQTDNIQQIKARVIPVAGRAATVYFHSFTFRPRRRPTWVIGFDDNRGSVLNASAAITLRGVPGTYSGKQILDAYGFKATMYIVGSLAGTGGNLSGAQIRQLYNAGWDIQAQCNWNPVGDGQLGSRLMGPYGFGPWSIASVDTVANTITTTANHDLPNPAGSYGFPIRFNGTDLPAPLNTNTVYWGRRSTATAMTLHANESDSLAGTATVDLTTTGTPTNFNYSYALAAPNESSILNDYMQLNAYIESLGIPRPEHVAYNQGGIDNWVHKAAVAARYKTARSTNNESATSFVPDFQESGFMQAVPLNNVYQIENGISAATIRGYVDTVIDRGVWAGSYTHYVDTTNGQNLADLCGYLWVKQQAGEIDVCTVSEAYRRAISGRAST